MESILTKQYNDLKKRMAANVPVTSVVESTKKRVGESSLESKQKLKRPKIETITKDNYATLSGSSKNNFAVLAKIVKHLRLRHQKGETQPLTIDQILEETVQTDVTPRIRYWLDTEALQNNPKIEVLNENTYLYKPEFNIRSRNGLKRLLDKHASEARGGIFQESIEESLPNFKKILDSMSEAIVTITGVDKKPVVFTKPIGLSYSFDEEIQKFWRSASVEGMNESKIQEYLQRHNITSMENVNRALTRKPPPKKNRKAGKKNKELKHNSHIAGMLNDYEK